MKPFIKTSSLIVTPMLLFCTLYKHSGKVHIDIAKETTKEESNLLKNKTPRLQMMLKPLLDKVKKLSKIQLTKKMPFLISMSIGIAPRELRKCVRSMG